MRVFERVRRPAGGKYTDLSALDSFRFVFHCERCGAGVSSEKYGFNTEGFDQPLDESARALLWTEQHDNAYRRASGEAKFEFNLCPVCGRRVCGACFFLMDEAAGICTDCRREAAGKPWRKRPISPRPC